MSKRGKRPVRSGKHSAAGRSGGRRRSTFHTWRTSNGKSSPVIYRGKGAVSAPPTIEQQRSIAAVAERLGIEVEVPATQAEAGYVLDDLYDRERASKRKR